MPNCQYGDTRVTCVCLSTNRGYAKKSWPIVDLYKRCLSVMCARQQIHTYKWYNGLQQPCFYMLCLLPRSMSQKHLMKLMTHTGCVVQEIVNEHAPIKQRTIKGNHIPYMNGELRRAINVKRMLKRKFTKCNSNMNWDKYRKQRNIVTTLVKKSLQQ